MNYITLKDLALELGMDRSHLRKYVLDVDIDMFRVRTEDSRNQATLAVSLEDAARVRASRLESGFRVQNRQEEISNPTDGFFYVVALDPIMRPDRIKVGFSSSLESRLSTYKTTNPDAEIIGSWRCKRNWEVAAIALVEATPSCSHVASELFDCSDFEELQSRCDTLFDLLHPED